MSNWSTGDVIANGIRIHYYRTGGDKPKLVLSHGFSDSGPCWIRVANALESEYDIVMYDARGHGRSEAPEEGYTSIDRAADLAGLVETLGLKRPAIMGHSMGASTTLYAAALYPDLFSRAILEDGGPRNLARFDPARSAEIHQRARDQREKPIEQLIAGCRIESPKWDEIEMQPWAEAKKLLSPQAIGRPMGAEAITWQDAIARVKCPMLLITADNELGSGVTPDVAAEAQRILPSLKVVNLPGAGHNVRREQFEPFVKTVREFLA